MTLSINGNEGKMHRRYKRLDVPEWVKLSKKLKSSANNPINDYEPCEKVFHKNGLYYDRLTKKSWVEWEDVSFVYDSDIFLCRLLSLNIKRLSDAELNAISVLNMYGLKNEELNKMAMEEECNRMLRRTMVSARLSRKRILGR